MNKTLSCEATADSLLAGFMNVGRGGVRVTCNLADVEKKGEHHGYSNH